MQTANINGPAIEIIFINESIFLSPFLGEILIRVSFCYYILIFDKSLENPFFYEKIFFIFRNDGKNKMGLMNQASTVK